MTLPTPPADWVQRVEREQLLRRRLHAERRGLDVDDYLTACQSHLERLCSTTEVRVRVRATHFGAVLADERLRNQFETGHSGGYFDPSTRAELELRMLGVPLTTKAADRPIYGYLWHSDEDWALPAYGTVILRLRPEVRRRCTFTIGDTLDQTLAARLPAFAPAPLERPRLLAANPARDLLAVSTFADAADRIHRYAEAQIYGGVTHADFLQVVFSARFRPTHDLVTELEEAGIPWEVQ